MDRELIIFGSGKIGYEALQFFGRDNISCFCDNNPRLAGTEKYGKAVISFDELKRREAVVIIAVLGAASYAIAEQCEENEIWDYIIYTILRESYPEWAMGGQSLKFIAVSENRMRLRKDIWLKRAKRLQRQVDYFRNHADIRHMKPAGGQLRIRQMESAQASADFFEKISTLGIKPILDSGNLLGYVRHNGYIPWDDDIDFVLFRKEYERLKEYCRLHIYEEREYDEKSKGKVREDIGPEMSRYFWAEYCDRFSVVVELDHGNGVVMDFFCLDYYAEGYSLQELKETARRVKEKLICMDSEEEKIQYMKKVLAENSSNIVEQSNNIYFSIDNMEIMSGYQRDCYIPGKVVFPLRRVLWEGRYFWVPNNAEEYLTYEYEHPWDFPEDVGIPSHYKIGVDEV